MLRKVSAVWARCELVLAALCVVLVSGLILTNVVTRSAAMAIYWIDEAAIYVMIWMTFLAASAAIRTRGGASVTLLAEVVPQRAQRWLRLYVDVVVFIFACAMITFFFWWFDPITLSAMGFDTEAFQGATFNFVYAEPTVTLGIKKAWIWLVMGIFALGACLHATSNLYDSIKGQAAPTDRTQEPS
ncbi:MAG: TRAP transporter small permease subunit [Pseudomonadota bacterium]